MYKNNPCWVARFRNDCQERAESHVHTSFSAQVGHTAQTRHNCNKFGREGRRAGGGGAQTEDKRDNEARSAASPEGDLSKTSLPAPTAGWWRVC